MVFITAGMGGGTGTGAAPVIAKMARERGILTVGVVTKPFTFEGVRRAKAAEAGIAELQQYVDTLIVIPNQNLFRLANEKTGWKEAFKMADHVLYMGVRGVTDLMVAPGLVNLDFADIRTVMAEMGKAMMGTGEAEGENRAIRAAEAAISNPLLEETNMAGARGLLINITGGEDMTLFEVDQAANRIREEVADDANIIFGSAVDDNLSGRIRVSVVATGIDTPVAAAAEPNVPRPRLVAVGGNGGPVPMPAMAQPGLAVQPPVTISVPNAQGAHATAQIMQFETAGQPAPQAGMMVAPAVETQVQQTHQAPRPNAPVRGGLFTEPPRAAPPATTAPAALHRPSIFSRMTGALRGEQKEAEGARHEPQVQPEREPAALVRPAAAEPEPTGLDIPAFLRRQSN
jgi:cell division protein FtsZ